MMLIAARWQTSYASTPVCAGLRGVARYVVTMYPLGMMHVGHVGDSWRQLCTERGLGQRETLDFVIERARWTNQLLEP